MTDDPGQVLEGITVLELGHAIAAPFAAGILGDFGANVIKVERPGVGDHMRGLGPRKEEQPLWWKCAARNKSSITLDFTKPAGAEIMRDLIERADVVVENFRPGILERYGFGWEQASEINPELVMVRISGYGQDSSKAKQPGFGRMADSMSGAANLTGEPDGPPTHVGFSLADTLSGLMGAYGAVMALFGRERTGVGECVDIALFEPLMRLIDWQVIVYDQLGIVPDRAGGAFPLPLEGVAAGVTKSRDGKWMSFSSATDTVLSRLVKLVFGEAGLKDPRFVDATARRQNVAPIQEAVSAWIEQRDADEVEREFARADAVVCRIFDMEMIWQDQTIRERQAIIEVDDQDLGPVAMHGVVPKLARRPGKVRHTGPGLGSATERILESIGRGDQVDELRGAGVI